jgi:hypothetical protein
MKASGRDSDASWKSVKALDIAVGVEPKDPVFFLRPVGSRVSGRQGNCWERGEVLYYGNE